MHRAATISVFAVLLLFGAGCGSGSETTSEGSTSPTSGTTPAGTASSVGPTTPSSTDGETPDGAEVGVRVYFAKDEAVATAGRTATGPSVAQAAMEAVLAGPEGVETEIGMTSEIPEGTELLGLDIGDGVATVDLSDAFESGGGSLSMQLRVAQVVFTLTQFDTVDTVDFRIDGTPVESIGGEGILVDGVDRASFESVTPGVLIESPVPGQGITAPLEISGMANTFEATVRYAVTDGEGLIIDEGFTTATAGNGTFGTFSLTSTFDGGRPGVGAVTAFEQSAQDGSPMKVYEVPVAIG